MEILRYAAFTTDPDAGNPAGVVLDATGEDDAAMLAAAAAAIVGYLREPGMVQLPATVRVHQGDDSGRPGVVGIAPGSRPASAPPTRPAARRPRRWASTRSRFVRRK